MEDCVWFGADENAAWQDMTLEACSSTAAGRQLLGILDGYQNGVISEADRTALVLEVLQYLADAVQEFQALAGTDTTSASAAVLDGLHLLYDAACAVLENPDDEAVLPAITDAESCIFNASLELKAA